MLTPQHNPKQQPGTPPAHGARHPRSRSIHSHLRQYSRPALSVGGLSAILRLRGGSGKGMVRDVDCMGLWGCSPVLAAQTVRGGAKDRPGPSPGVLEQLRWAVGRVCEGGGGVHPHPVLAGQVWVALHGGRMGGGDEGMVVGWWAYPCAVAGLLVDAIDSTTLSTQLMGWGSSSRRGVRGGGSG